MARVISTWFWGTAYSLDYVAKLFAGVRRHHKGPFRLVCVTDQPEKVSKLGIEPIVIPKADRYLLEVKGCFARLRMFDPQWQSKNGITDQLVNIDLDTVVTGPIDSLFDRPEPFVILHGGNFANPCKFGGALMMLRAGAHPEVWAEFSLEAAGKCPYYSFPDDQGWIWDRLPDAAGWACGPESGVYVFRKTHWPRADYLPRGARLVTFNGWRNPESFKKLDWIRKHWVA